jgi:hypothetical protein
MPQVLLSLLHLWRLQTRTLSRRCLIYQRVLMHAEGFIISSGICRNQLSLHAVGLMLIYLQRLGIFLVEILGIHPVLKHVG